MSMSKTMNMRVALMSRSGYMMCFLAYAEWDGMSEYMFTTVIPTIF